MIRRMLIKRGGGGTAASGIQQWQAHYTPGKRQRYECMVRAAVAAQDAQRGIRKDRRGERFRVLSGPISPSCSCVPVSYCPVWCPIYDIRYTRTQCDVWRVTTRWEVHQMQSRATACGVPPSTQHRRPQHQHHSTSRIAATAKPIKHTHKAHSAAQHSARGA
jgi:hypothetical protein